MAAAPAWPGRPPVDPSAHHFLRSGASISHFFYQVKKELCWRNSQPGIRGHLGFEIQWIWALLWAGKLWRFLWITDTRRPGGAAQFFPLIYFPFQAWTSSQTRKTQKELCWKQIQLPFDHNMKLISCYGKSRSNRVGNRRPGRSPDWSWQVASYEWVQSQDKYTTNPRKIKQELCWKNNPLEGHEFIGSIQTSASMGSARFS